jgi:hypothetical protein
VQGHDPKKQTEYLKEIKTMFGGAALTALVKKRKVEITAAEAMPPPFEMRCDAATFYGEDGNFEIFLQSDSAADPDKRKELLIHELRHLQQFDDIGRWQKNHTCLGGAATRNAFVQNLLTEADAYTFQTLALAPVTAAKRVLEIPAGIFNEAARFEDEEKFCRAYFTRTMLYGLSAYLEDYKGVIHDLIEGSPLEVEAARKYFAAVPTADIPNPSDKLTAIYGEKFMSETSMRAIQAAFMRTVPLENRVPLRKYDAFMRSLGTLSQDDYSQARETLLSRFEESADTDRIKRRYGSEDEVSKRTEQLERLAVEAKPPPLSRCLVTEKNRLRV